MRTFAKAALRLAANLFDLLAVAAMLALLFPFWLIDKAERTVKRARD